MNPDKKIVGVGHNELPKYEEWPEKKFDYWEKRDLQAEGAKFEETKYAYGEYYSITI